MEHLSIFLNSLSPENKGKFRVLERIQYKIIGATHSINFNTNCIRERLYPKGKDNKEKYE